MSTSYGPPYCPVCKAYMWTTDISNRYRCHCPCTCNDIKYFRESMAKAFGIDPEELLKSPEEKKD